MRSGAVPKAMEDALYANMEPNAANIVMREIESMVAIRAAEAPASARRASVRPPTRARIDLDSQISPYSIAGRQYASDIRRRDALSYEDVELMQRCGIMVFASRLKKSSIITSLSNPRYWNIVSQDDKLKAVVEHNLVNVFQRHADDIMMALDYGAVFMAKEWAYRTAEEIGVPKELVEPGSQWWVVDALKSAPPETVTEVLRNRNTLEFKGFLHERKNIQPDEVTIAVPQALVVNYNSYFGNIWGQSVYEPVYDYWFWYEIAMRSFMRYLERMGVPVAVAKAPSRGTVERPDGTIVNNAEWAMVVAGDAGRSSAVYIPSDVDPTTGQPLWALEYLSADQRGDQFVKALELLGTWILRGMIVGDRAATQDSEVGSYAAALVHSGYTELDNDLIYKSVVGQLNRYLMPDYGRYNVGPQAPPVLLKTEGLDPREKDRIMKLVSTAGNQKLGSGSPFDILDWRTMFEAVDLPTLTEEERKEMLEGMTDEAIEKQKKFNDLQAEQAKQMGDQGQQPPAKNPFKQPSVATGGRPSGQQQKNQLFEALGAGGLVPILLSPGEVGDMLGIDRQDGGTIILDGSDDGLWEDESEEQEDSFFGLEEYSWWEGDDLHYMLFNPYHDEKGRFTTPKHAIGSGGESRNIDELPDDKRPGFVRRHKKAIVAGAVIGTVALGGAAFYMYASSYPFLGRGRDTATPIESVMGSTRGVFFNSYYGDPLSPMDQRTIRSELDRQEQYLNDHLEGFTGLGNEQKIYVENYRGLHGYLKGGYHSPITKEISLSTTPWKDGDTDYFLHAALHEQIHSRKPPPDLRNVKTFGDLLELRKGALQNEAATEIIARKLYIDMYGKPSPSKSYNSLVRVLGNYVAKAFPNDPEAGWDYISSLQMGGAAMPEDLFENEEYLAGDTWRWLIESSRGINLAEQSEIDMQVYKLMYLGDYEAALKLAADNKNVQLMRDIINAWEDSGTGYIEFDPIENSEQLAEYQDGISLFNPHHDELGRFTDAVHAHGPTALIMGGIVGQVAGAATGIIGEYQKRKAKKIRKEYRYKRGEEGEEARIKAIELEKSSKKLIKVGGVVQYIASSAFLVGLGWSINKTVREDIARQKAQYEREANRARERAYREWEDRQRRHEQARERQQARGRAQWPPGATEDQFKKMYRDLAKKHHPDLGGSTSTMQAINKAYEDRDWGTLEDLLNRLSDFFDTITLAEKEGSGQLSALVELFIDFVWSDNEYIVFDDSKDWPGRDWPREENGNVIVDKPMIAMIVSSFLEVVDDQEAIDAVWEQVLREESEPEKADGGQD